MGASFFSACWLLGERGTSAEARGLGRSGRASSEGTGRFAGAPLGMDFVNDDPLTDLTMPPDTSSPVVVVRVEEGEEESSEALGAGRTGIWPMKGSFLGAAGDAVAPGTAGRGAKEEGPLVLASDGMGRNAFLAPAGGSAGSFRPGEAPGGTIIIIDTGRRAEVAAIESSVGLGSAGVGKLGGAAVEMGGGGSDVKSDGLDELDIGPEVALWVPAKMRSACSNTEAKTGMMCEACVADSRLSTAGRIKLGATTIAKLENVI